MRSSITLLCVCIAYSLCCVASGSTLICPRQSQPLFLNALRFRCPLTYAFTSPLEVNGDYLDRVLTSKRGNLYTSVLLYAAWCPFSKEAHKMFGALSSMYPQIEHLAVEYSSTMPSLFSRYGIHSLPTLLMVNQTSRMRFHGSKNLDSLIEFYRKTTGLEPVQYLAVDDFSSQETSGGFVRQPWVGFLADKISSKEPYLLFSVLFVGLRAVLYLYPKILYHLKTVWLSHRPHLNLEIFGEASQMLWRIVHMIDVKIVWTKLRNCKGWNFRQGAKNARVWASSLASVSLGKASMSRSLS